MAAQYTYTLGSSVVEILVLIPRTQARFLTAVFNRLSNDPYQRGHSIFYDSSGREIQKKAFDHWIVSFWTDHAVKEVRIVGIQQRR